MSIGENKVPDVGEINPPIIGTNHFRDHAKMVPLTLDKLREMGGQPYWHVGLQDNSPEPHWKILDPFVARCPEDYGYGKRWLAYDYLPAHIDREAWEPCELCHGNKLDSVGVGDHFGLRVYLRGGNKNPPENERFQFCPKCGRPRTEEAWAELEKRFRG